MARGAEWPFRLRTSTWIAASSSMRATFSTVALGGASLMSDQGAAARYGAPRARSPQKHEETGLGDGAIRAVVSRSADRPLPAAGRR
jgi:hypothetical protein